MKTFKILYWKKEKLGEHENILFMKRESLEEVIESCQSKRLVSYCIFDDLGLNVYSFGNGIGNYNSIPKYARKMAFERKEQKKK